MSFELKGFINNSSFTNNATAGGVAQIGELSQLSLTYSRHIGEYVSANGPTLQLVTFTSSLDGAYEQLTQNIADHVLSVAQNIFNYAGAQGQIFPDLLLQELLTAFGTVANTFQVGNIIFDGAHYMPEWVSWINTSIPTIQATGNAIRIWFVDNSFQNEFDDYDIIVVPPMPNLNNFFEPASTVAQVLAAQTVSTALNLVQTAKGGFPETLTECVSFNYVDPANAANLIPTNWFVIIYGQAGNNEDAINAAIVNYVLANSSESQVQWTAILPDLFNRTEFILMPLWQNYSIPNSSLQSGIYSPIANLTNSLALLEQVDPGYPTSHINSHATMFGYPYKSMMVMSIGSPNNKNSLFELQEVFTDFIAVTSTSNDFDRMSQATQAFATMFAAMVIIAESMTTESSVPAGMQKLTRGNILYVSQSYQGIYYLVAAKSNFPLPV